MNKSKADSCMADFEPEEAKYILEPDRRLTSLESWYHDKRLVPFGELSAWDVSRAITQRICLEQLVPIAIELLQENPMAGEWYEGDLLDAMRKVPIAYWSTHIGQRDAMKIVCERVVEHEDYKNDQADIDSILDELKKNLTADKA